MSVVLPAVITPMLTASVSATLVAMLPAIALSLAVVYGFGLIPKLQTVLAAEAGRKKDLVRRAQVQGFDFDVAIVLPFLDEADYPALVDCLTCLAAQQYPLEKVKWVILAGKEVQPYHTMVQTLVEKAIGKVNNATMPLVWLPVPATVEAANTAVAWGCKTLLNQVTVQLVAFLQPTDLVKPDFVNQLTVKAYSHEVIQGYVASRELGAGWLHQLLGIETRIASRIETAGRFHAKKPLLLRTSGFAIKTTLLEQLPWPAVAGQQASWLYSLALARYQVPIAWAPTVVVYTRITATLPQAVVQGWKRIGVLASLAIQSLTLAVKKPVIAWVTALELASYWCVLPEAAMLAIGAVLISAGVWCGQPITHYIGSGIAISALVFQIAMFRVSRLSWQESLTYSVLKPCLLVAMVLALPVMVVQASVKALQWLVVRIVALLAFVVQYRGKAKTTTLRTVLSAGGSSESVLRNSGISTEPASGIPASQDSTELSGATPYWLPSAEAVAPLSTYSTVIETNDSAPIQPVLVQQQASTTGVDVTALETLWHTVVEQFGTIETRYAVTLLFGTKSVQATIEVRSTPQQGIQLTLQYKTQSFKTALYPLFSQAFYELQAKLAQYNIQLNSCGSCAYYYQPASALQVQQGKQVGLCLKQGEQQLLTPALQPTTVLSPACEHHTALDQRTTILTTVSQQLKSLT